MDRKQGRLWPIGKIVALLPSRDGQPRRYLILINGSEKERSSLSLSPLLSVDVGEFGNETGKC